MDPSLPHAIRPARRAAPEPGAGSGRFELRAFGPHLERVGLRMRRRGVEVGTATQRKVYLLGARQDVNLKVRDGRLEVKRLVERRGALERWAPEASRELPLDPDWARAALPPLLGVPELATLPDPGEAPLCLREIVLLAEAARPRVEVVTVSEERRRFRLGAGVRGEVAQARVAGLPVQTAALEAAHPAELRRAALLVGLDPSTNTSWPAVLRALCVAPDGLDPEASRNGG